MIETKLKKQDKNRQTTIYIRFNYSKQVIEIPSPPPQNIFQNYSQIKQQFKTCKEQEKYKKRFFNSLKNNKNKWWNISNGFVSKTYISKYQLKRREDILKKQYISSVKERSNIKKKKEALFDLEDNIVTEKSINFSEGAKIKNIMQILKVLKISEQVNLAL
ncbi:hypothetical protein RhiirA4_469937 [Rhizophagus irregularis]|uniref:Uncharacterized protein n=1 Tax=Rhizophagus irregularis TaxID=588596 RepID=A0A2I1H0C5_9GLOM|nr:hypothetical protein RhiirA4_469937 [Rhizophagus irregularis]